MSGWQADIGMGPGAKIRGTRGGGGTLAFIKNFENINFTKRAFYECSFAFGYGCSGHVLNANKMRVID